MDAVVVALIAAFASGVTALLAARISRMRVSSKARPEVSPEAVSTLIALAKLHEATSADLAVSARRKPAEMVAVLGQLREKGWVEAVKAPEPLAAGRITSEGLRAAHEARALAGAWAADTDEPPKRVARTRPEMSPEELDAAIDRALARLDARPSPAT